MVIPISPFQGLVPVLRAIPRALPWAIVFRPFGAEADRVERTSAAVCTYDRSNCAATSRTPTRKRVQSSARVHRLRCGRRRGRGSRLDGARRQGQIRRRRQALQTELPRQHGQLHQVDGHCQRRSHGRGRDRRWLRRHSPSYFCRLTRSRQRSQTVDRGWGRPARRQPRSDLAVLARPSRASVEDHASAVATSEGVTNAIACVDLVPRRSLGL